MALYYHKITGQIVGWDTLKGMFGSVFASTVEGSASMHGRLYDQNPPNTYLDTYPDLANWFVLEQPATPSHALYEIVEEGTPSFIAATDPAPDKGKYKKTWIVRNRVRTPIDEMLGVNQYISSYAKDLRDQKLDNAVIEYNGFFADATDQTTLAISRLVEFLKSKGDENATIAWKGLNDPTTGLPRWEEANISDLQNLSVAVEEFRQKAFKSENAVLAVQLENLAVDIETTFESLADVETFFNNIYNGL